MVPQIQNEIILVLQPFEAMVFGIILRNPRNPRDQRGGPVPVPCHEKRHEGQGGVARLHGGSPKTGGKPPQKNVVFKIWKMMMNQSKSHWILGTSYFQTKPRWSEVRTIATKLVTEHATT